MAATEEPIESVLKAIAVGVMGGEVERNPDDTIVKIAMRIPAVRVMSPSAGQDTRGDAATCDQDGRDVTVGVSAELCELDAAMVGRGEGKRNREQAKAK